MLLFRNSLILAVSITVLNMLLSALAAYAIAKIPLCARHLGVILCDGPVFSVSLDRESRRIDQKP